jgi:hypothetical protein
MRSLLHKLDDLLALYCALPRCLLPYSPRSGRGCMTNAIAYLPRLACQNMGDVGATQREALPGIGVARGVRRGQNPAFGAPRVTVEFNVAVLPCQEAMNGPHLSGELLWVIECRFLYSL